MTLMMLLVANAVAAAVASATTYANMHASDAERDVFGMAVSVISCVSLALVAIAWMRGIDLAGAVDMPITELLFP